MQRPLLLKVLVEHALNLSKIISLQATFKPLRNLRMVVDVGMGQRSKPVTSVCYTGKRILAWSVVVAVDNRPTILVES